MRFGQRRAGPTKDLLKQREEMWAAEKEGLVVRYGGCDVRGCGCDWQCEGEWVCGRRYVLGTLAHLQEGFFGPIFSRFARVYIPYVTERRSDWNVFGILAHLQEGGFFLLNFFSVFVYAQCHRRALWSAMR